MSSVGNSMQKPPHPIPLPTLGRGDADSGSSAALGRGVSLCEFQTQGAGRVRAMRRVQLRYMVLLIGLSISMLTAWMVGPDYRRPEVAVPADWRSPVEGTGSLADLGSGRS